ncbi:peptidase M20 [Cupriavidus sp. USMAA2-4]|uniref:amidohydrolase n=1 Tax=Cupriavidus sp. USMAA2-4 TaxID=876364 RepID=UPI0008A711C0|nr:amidohydrolase [Cupriavidus sp. USMAA2-4]AOY96504.1 peptidase M20 [Cupriavidus sp. USMAA2-4]
MSHRRRAVQLACTALLTLCAASAGAQDSGAIDPMAARQAVDAQLSAIYPDLDALYKDIHAHPELGFQETRTAATLAREMRRLGFEVTEGLGKTGLVAIYRNGSGPTVMVRTELDALPMAEKTGLPYASQVVTDWNGKPTPMAHSCGHDIHMAAWVGTARTLVALKERWHGTLMFVAQPAEELVSGAESMLKAGLFTRFGKPDYAFALHTAPAPVGMIGFNSGAVTSNSDGLEVRFKGRGGHGSAPDKTIDPIMMGSRFVVDLQSVVSREKDPQEFGVVTVGAFQSGTVGNIIPDEAIVRGTIRSYKPEVREGLLAGVRRTARAVADMAGAPEPEVRIEAGGKAVNNDAQLVSSTEAVLRGAYGKNVMHVPPITASEDFSDFVNAGVPSMFFFVGVYDLQRYLDSRKPGAAPLPSNHSPYFAPVPEPSIKTGVGAMSLAVMNALTLPKTN